MTQQVEMVQEVQNLEELQNLKRPGLVALMKQFKAEDTDCLPEVHGNSKKDELIEALAKHMGFTATVEAEIKSEVNKDIAEAVHNSDDVEQADVMDFGGDVPSLQDSLFGGEEPKIEIIKVGDAPKPETTGNFEVDAVLAELGLDGLDALNPTDLQTPDVQAEEPQAEEAPKKKGGRRATIPMDAPIPVRQYESLLIGVYGNILEQREEPFPEGHKYEGLTHEEIKLERFSPKAHEQFRKTKGHMHLLYTNTSSTYLIVLKKADGTIDPILEVANKGRGHLRCKQIANHLLVAYNEKNDQEVISAEEYMKLAEQIELLPINAESVGA